MQKEKKFFIICSLLSPLFFHVNYSYAESKTLLKNKMNDELTSFQLINKFDSLECQWNKISPKEKTIKESSKKSVIDEFNLSINELKELLKKVNELKKQKHALKNGVSSQTIRKLYHSSAQAKMMLDKLLGETRSMMQKVRFLEIRLKINSGSEKRKLLEDLEKLEKRYERLSTENKSKIAKMKKVLEEALDEASEIKKPSNVAKEEFRTKEVFKARTSQTDILNEMKDIKRELHILSLKASMSEKRSSLNKEDENRKEALRKKIERAEHRYDQLESKVKKEFANATKRLEALNE